VSREGSVAVVALTGCTTDMPVYGLGPAGIANTLLGFETTSPAAFGPAVACGQRSCCRLTLVVGCGV
jgi:hypothetical protein